MTKAPKLYFVDPAPAAFLTGLHHRDSVLHGPSIGALAETAVVAEWLKAFRARGERPSMYFWHGRGLEATS